jgi:hypothetical protein
MAYDDEDDYDAFISKLAQGSNLNAPEPAAAATSRNSPQVDALIAQMGSFKPNARDPALGERWRDEENNTLNRVQNGDDYDLGKVLRDIAPLAVGVIGDVAGNKGRGLGGIATAAMSNVAQNAARDDLQRKNDQDYALKQRAQRESSNGGSDFDRAYKQLQVLNERDRIGLAGQNTGLRTESVGQGERKVKIAEDQNAYINDPNDPRTIAAKARLIANGANPDQIGNLSANALRDTSAVTGHEVDHAFSNLEREDAAKKAAATSAASTGAEINTKAGLKDVAADTEATIGGAREAATKAAEINTAAGLSDVSAGTAEKQAGAATQGRLGAEQDASADAFLDPVARAVTDPERAERVKRNPKLGAEATEKMRASGGALDSIAKMVDIRQQEAQGVIAPGRAKSQMLTARAELEGAFAKGHDMATINEGDRTAMGQFLGVPDASILDIASLITGGDIKLDQLKGVQDVLSASDQRTAREYGYGGYGSAKVGQQAPAPNRSRVAPSGGGASGSNNMPSGGMVTIRLGGDTRQVPADQAQRLKAMNPDLEVL